MFWLLVSGWLGCVAGYAVAAAVCRGRRLTEYRIVDPATGGVVSIAGDAEWADQVTRAFVARTQNDPGAAGTARGPEFLEGGSS